MGKYPPAVPSVPPGLSREGDMLGKPTNLKFMDRDIIAEQTVQDLSRDQYSYCRAYTGCRDSHHFQHKVT
jgi:hypothetical protein